MYLSIKILMRGRVFRTTRKRGEVGGGGGGLSVQSDCVVSFVYVLVIFIELYNYLLVYIYNV